MHKRPVGGWTVHFSKTTGRIWYKHSSGVQSWEQPPRHAILEKEKLERLLRTVADTADTRDMDDDDDEPNTQEYLGAIAKAEIGSLDSERSREKREN